MKSEFPVAERRNLPSTNFNNNAREDDYKVDSNAATPVQRSLAKGAGANLLKKVVADPRFQERSKSSRQCRAICVQAAGVFVSTVGLSLLVAGYSCLGGVVFEWLERENELMTKESARQVMEALRKLYTADLYSITQNSEKNRTDDTVSKLNKKLRQLSHKVFALITENNWDGTDDSNGDIVTDWAFPGALLFSVTTITTIGYGFIAPVTTTGRIICIFYSIFGLPITMLAIANIGLWLARQVRKVYGSIETLARRQSRVTEERTTAQEVPVLFSLVIMMVYIFMGAVIFAEWEGWSLSDGAYFSFVTLATIGYGDLVPGVYTGKGDWVKGKSADTVKLIICGVYLFMGLSLLAMCMDLMKEEVSANFLWLGYKTGIIRQRKPEDVIAWLKMQEMEH